MADTQRFHDRTDAGNQLADALRDRELGVDIVLAIPQGGLPLGRAVADALDVPLDVVVAKKIGAPGNPEYAIGAVAADGSVWRNEYAFRMRDIDEEYFEQTRREEAKNAQEKVDRYRGDRPTPDLARRTVTLVDDRVATGSTARACLEQVRASGTQRVVLSIPVGPPDTVTALQSVTDEVVLLETPTSFGGVGRFYEQFDQVSDDEAMAFLER